MAVDLSAMRKLFNSGELKSAIVAPAPMESGWVLNVVRADGTRDYMTKARSSEHKVYKTVEAVVADVKRVGLREVMMLVA